jgi:hypothetical protein
MLNLKEACRYGNFLEGLFVEMQLEFLQEDYMFSVTEKHFKSKACANTEDEIIEASPDVKYNIENFNLHGVSNLLMDIIDEKLRLSLAIEEGKKSIKIDWKENGQALSLDTALEYNKKLRTLSNSYLEKLIDNKSSECKGLGTDYSFNQEGNQMPYIYNIEIVKTINYDRNSVRALSKKILKKTDQISILIDEAMLKQAVDFKPEFDLHDSIEEIIQKYTTSNLV